MKVFIACSTAFYDKIPNISEKLISKGYEIIYPNGYFEENTDDTSKMNEEEYLDFFKRMYYESKESVSSCDKLLVLNYTKLKNNVELKNYIGASVFLEMYEAFMQNKQIYILNDIPNNMLYDEIKGFNPIILNGDIDKI